MFRIIECISRLIKVTVMMHGGNLKLNKMCACVFGVLNSDT